MPPGLARRQGGVPRVVVERAGRPGLRRVGRAPERLQVAPREGRGGAPAVLGDVQVERAGVCGPVAVAQLDRRAGGQVGGGPVGAGGVVRGVLRRARRRRSARRGCSRWCGRRRRSAARRTSRRAAAGRPARRRRRRPGCGDDLPGGAQTVHIAQLGAAAGHHRDTVGPPPGRAPRGPRRRRRRRPRRRSKLGAMCSSSHEVSAVFPRLSRIGKRRRRRHGGTRAAL